MPSAFAVLAAGVVLADGMTNRRRLLRTPNRRNGNEGCRPETLRLVVLNTAFQKMTA